MKIPSPRGGPHASRKRFPLSAPRTAPAGRAHALLARGLPLLLIALAALVLSSVGHAQDLDTVLVSNTGQTAGSDLATATGRVSYAQSFTTGDHPDGYFLSSVDVGLKADSGVTAEVALWWSGLWTSDQRIGFFSFPNHILTTLSGVPDIDNDASTLERFSANDVLLLPATTYWIVVTRTGGADDGLSVATTSSEAAVDAGGMAGFSVGNNVWVPTSSLDPDAPEWDDYSGSVDASMKIGLRGSEATRPPGPYASNRNEQSRAAAAETSSSTSRYATSFTTASAPDTHQLTSVLLGVAAEAGVSPRVAIHADASGGRPAASALTNGTLTAPADVSRVLGAPERAEFTASPAISLAGGTRYWVVLDVGSGTGSLSVSTTASDDNDEVPQPQWSIDATMKAYSGTSWSNDSQGRTFRMALNGPTDQYIGPPFEPLREVRIGLPQVGVGVAAEISDQSFRLKNATWQWQRGETSDGTFTDIPAAQGGTSRVYVPAAADLGKWLKALASYENAFGPGKMVSGVSGQAVFSQPIMSNAGQISSVGYVVLQSDTVNIAQAFTTGGNPSGYSLSGLRFGIHLETDIDALSWALHDDNAGEPAAEPLFTHITVPSDSLDGNTRTFEDLVHPGFPLAPDTKYWAVLTASPLMEGTGGPTLGAAGISEWGERVILDGPAAELDPGSESGWTLHFSTLSTPHDPLSTEEWVTFTEALELEVNGKMALRMSVLTHPEVTASFGQESYTVAEGATQSVTVTLSADPERTVTIPIVTMGQDGASSVDYAGVPDSVTFNAGGPTEMTFTFTATQDTVDDEGESVLLGFGSDLSGGVSAGTPDETTLTITDDDPPEVSFGQSAYTVAEGGMVSVEVKLTSAPASAVTVPVTHTPQGATSSADYSGVPSSVTFSAGETSKAFTFTATQDTVDDDGESVLLTFGTLPATVQTGTTTQSTVNITDDDAAAVSFGQSAYTVAEGGMVSVEVKLTSAPASAVTVPVTHTPQGATSSADYSGVPSSVTFSAGETSKTFSFTATQDTVDDDGESVLLTFGTLPATVQTGTTTETTVTITDDDAPAGKVALELTPATINESGTGNASTVTASIPSASSAATTVTVSVNPTDTTTLTGNTILTIPAGDTDSTGVVTITAVNDDAVTGNRTVAVSGTAVNSVGVTDPDDATLTITDDDAAAGKVALELTPATINESGTGNASTVTASIPSASSAATTVTVSVNPADTTTLTGNTILTIPAGDTNSTGVVTITAVNDDAVTGNRTVAVSGTAVNSVGVTDPDDATLTITDDDAAAGKVALELTPATINESGTGNASTVTASIPSASSAATTVTVSVNPADTTTLTGNTTLTIAAGDTDSTGVVTITAVNDDAYTGNRMVAVSGTAVNSVGVTDPDDVTLTITDDDAAAGKVILELTPATINESGTGNASTVTASIPSASSAATTVTVSVNPTDTTTLTGNTTLTIPAGDTDSTGVVTITAVNDDAYTGNRMVAVSGTAVNSVGVTDPDDVTLTITDDDAAAGKVILELTPATINESGTGNASTVTASIPSASSAATTVTVSVNPTDTTTLTGNTTLTIPAGDTDSTGVVTITAVNDDAYTGNRMVAVSGTAVNSVGVTDPDDVTLTITDDDAAAGKVILELTPATINESGTGNASTVTASIPSASSAATTVTVSVNPTDTTTLTGNTILTIPAGDTDSTGVVTITAVNDDAYTWNRMVAVSGTAVNSVGITDPDDVTLTIREDDDIPAGCESGDIWCGTVAYADRFPSDAAGTKPLRWYHRDHDDQDMLEFAHNEFRYKVYSSSLGANPGGGTYVMPPFHIPERSSSLFGLGTLSATYWEMPNQDYLDWTLYISTNQDGATLEAKLPFNEAKFCCDHKWRWYGLDLYKLNEAWAVGKEYQLRIVEDPRADRTPEVLGPPLYLEALGVNRGSVLLRWVRPQVRNDGAPPGVKYKVQWKTAAGMWDTLAVSQNVYVPRPGEEVPGWTIRGLTPGSAYDVRVIAVNEAGDSAPSNVLRVNTDQAFTGSQNQAANSPATGGPGIIGSLLAGETLTATTENIEDEDGLTGAAFAYQWLRSDTDIEGAISSTYTMTDDDEGKAIQVRVTFSDDAGNEESLTSYARLSAPPLTIRDAGVIASDTPATGEPTITGTAQVGETLTADTTGISDSDGLANAIFTYQWLAEDADITDATGSTYTLAAADEGKTIKVQLSFTDDRGHQETLTSTATATVASAPSPLTAAIHDAPGSHDGTTDFTFELRFSEDLKEGFSYQTLRDHAFTVKGGTVAGARQMDGDSDTPNIRWEISVSPDSSADVTVELPATEDCDAQGAICTEDGTMLSSPLTITVEGPPLTASFESVPMSHNGSDNFKFRVAFSEELETSFSYKTLRDHVFTVEGGTVAGARRLVSGSNIRWEVTVEPDSSGDVTITLPATTDCDAQGAICADGDEKLSSRLERTVSGPGQ